MCKYKQAFVLCHAKKLLVEKKKLQGQGVQARVAERGYMPVLETKRGDKWLQYKFSAEEESEFNDIPVDDIHPPTPDTQE